MYSKEGKEETKRKTREANIAKYGVDNFTKTDAYKEKFKKTSLERYGVEHPSSSKENRDKAKATMLKRYGYEYNMQIPSVKAKARETWKKHTEPVKRKYQSLINKGKEVFEKLNQNNITPLFDEWKGIVETRTTKYRRYNFRCDICGTEWTDYFMTGRHFPKCPHCHPKNFQSSAQEREVFKLISNYISEVTANTRALIYPYELDIYVPSLNKAIEVNGVFWHSNMNVEQDYHTKKITKCDKKGITLAQIFEDEWKYKKSAMRRYIFDFIEVNTRYISPDKCSLVVDDTLASKFFDKYSLFDKELFTKHEVVKFGTRPVALFSYGNGFVSFTHLPMVNTNDIFSHFVKEGYDVISDNRFPESFIDSSWNLVRKSDPTFMYVVRDTRTKEASEDAPKVWDCGYSFFSR